MHVQRDPAARGRATALLLALVVLWPLLVVADFKPSAIFDAQNLKTTGNFLAAFLPPERGQEFIGFLARATLETVRSAVTEALAGERS